MPLAIKQPKAMPFRTSFRTAPKKRSDAWYITLILLVGAGRFERPTPCAQVGFQRFAKCPIFKLLVSLEIRAPC
jgi:hypothetical protein